MLTFLKCPNLCVLLNFTCTFYFFNQPLKFLLLKNIYAIFSSYEKKVAACQENIATRRKNIATRRKNNQNGEAKMNKSREDYLEAIHMIHLKKGIVRSVDVANELNFKKSSVSVAMKNLRSEGYITMDKNGHISLTENGLEIAKMIYERHTLLTDFFVSLGVPENTAAADACKLEHDMSPETFTALKGVALKYIES